MLAERQSKVIAVHPVKVIDWLIAVLRKLVSYEARAAAIRQDRNQLEADINRAISVKLDRIVKIEAQVGDLQNLRGTF